eukprot:3691418-Amphidinium_carterae.1
MLSNTRSHQELRAEGLRLEVNNLSLKTVLNAAEAFVTGTAAGLVPVEHISGVHPNKPPRIIA